MINKKIVLSIALLLFLGGAITVLAQGVGVQTTSLISPAKTPEPVILQVDSNGKLLLRGTVVSVSSSLMTVRGWGGTWNVNISSTTKLIPALLNNDIATQFKAGDFVGVRGTFSPTADWTVDATLIGNRFKGPEQKINLQIQDKNKPEIQQEQASQNSSGNQQKQTVQQSEPLPANQQIQQGLQLQDIQGAQGQLQQGLQLQDIQDIQKQVQQALQSLNIQDIQKQIQDLMGQIKNLQFQGAD